MSYLADIALRNVEIVRLRREGFSHPAIAARFGVTAQTVSRVLAGAHESDGDEEHPITDLAEQLAAVRANLAATLDERNVLREALEKYAHPLNWHEKSPNVWIGNDQAGAAFARHVLAELAAQRQ